MIYNLEGSRTNECNGNGLVPHWIVHTIFSSLVEITLCPFNSSSLIFFTQREFPSFLITSFEWQKFALTILLNEGAEWECEQGEKNGKMSEHVIMLISVCWWNRTEKESPIERKNHLNKNRNEIIDVLTMNIQRSAQICLPEVIGLRWSQAFIKENGIRNTQASRFTFITNHYHTFYLDSFTTHSHRHTRTHAHTNNGTQFTP